MPPGNNQTLFERFKSELNFFRVHVFVFVLTPLICAGIFFGVNGQFPVPFIDALFLCYSAMTVTGLSTVNLSTLTGFQQSILFVLMLAGDLTMVSLVMVLIRKHYFRTRCSHIAKKPRRRGAAMFRTASGKISGIISSPTIKSGFPVWDRENKVQVQEPTPHVTPRVTSEANIGTSAGEMADNGNEERLRPSTDSGDRGVIADMNSFTSSPRIMEIPLSSDSTNIGSGFPRSQTVQFDDTNTANARTRRRYTTMRRTPTVLTSNIPPTYVDVVDLPALEGHHKHRDRGFGGFPNPLHLITLIATKLFPQKYSKLRRRLSLDYTNTLNRETATRWLDIENSLIVTGNSNFHTEDLSDEDLEKIGGVEYRALRLLGYVIGLYFVLTQLISFIAIAGWFANSGTYDDVFEGQPRLIPKAWFAAFNVVGSYTGGGMSLVDAGMVPFQRAYLLIFFMSFVVLAGNHALPIFLRFTIWIMTKFVKENSITDQTLHFLLDHPRRCYIYMFPSEVTWFLVFALLVLSMLELFAFCVLDNGLEVTSSLPLGVRVVDGLFQSLAVRASGYSIVPIAELAPAVQYLFVIMMYIAVYPVAMSIRSTNVYEERSLGVFEEPPEEFSEEPNLEGQTLRRRDRIGKYLGWHVRKQLSYELWWLIIGVWLICIIERDKIMDDANAPWFNIFRIVFELVSAYGTIGLTLGIPTQNYSFSGAFTPLSKLVVIAIMVRGRHRGLPVAIDRAVLLPSEYKKPTPEIEKAEKPQQEEKR